MPINEVDLIRERFARKMDPGREARMMLDIVESVDPETLANLVGSLQATEDGWFLRPEVEITDASAAAIIGIAIEKL